MAKILVIDDEKSILMLIKNILTKDGHTVSLSENPKQIPINDYKKFDLILLDVMMPEIDGFTLCGQIRDLVDCPILFLTAKVMEDDITYGFGIGGDDYITKPFGNNELRARVTAHLRRESRVKHNALMISGIKFDLNHKMIMVADKKVPLTKSEYIICELLGRSRGQIFSKDQIYDALYGYEGEGDSSAVTEHVKNIRAKLKAFGCAPIETVWGIGYKWQ